MKAACRTNWYHYEKRVCRVYSGRLITNKVYLTSQLIARELRRILDPKIDEKLQPRSEIYSSSDSRT